MNLIKYRLNSKMVLRLFTAVLLIHEISAYQSFKENIPNGDSIPHPCKQNTMWEGVGHFLDVGTGPRNPFGLDFQNKGMGWTNNLCRMDSDGDGRTNGQELGDPNCTWAQNSTPAKISGLSHPGICDPWDSPTCLNKPIVHPVYKTQGDWLRAICKTNQFICPGKNESGVMNVSLNLPNNTKVPAKQTTYMCQMFDMTSSMSTKDYHLVAVEPIIDNAEVLHHMVLFGCKDDQPMITSPFECGMVASHKCQNFLSVWTVGLSGDCPHPLAAIRLGFTGYKKIAIQYHWNNPNKRSDMTDQSGMILYYTPNLRLYDAGILLVGSSRFTLPPKHQSVTITSTCTQGCSRNLVNDVINITMAWNHMHYAGIKMSIELLRNRNHLMYLTNDPVYSYDSPQLYNYIGTPIAFQPGDEMVTRCTYNTANRNHTTLSGEGTYDEMCFGFITYFPKKNMQNGFCLSGGPDVNFCDQQSAVDHGCPEMWSFWDPVNLNSSVMYQQLVENCKPFSPCQEECVQYMTMLHEKSKCFTGELYDFIKFEMLMKHDVGKDMMARLASCDVQVNALLNTWPIAATTVSSKYIKEGGPYAKASMTTITPLVVMITFVLSIFLVSK